MSNKRYDIYIGCADKYNKEKENVEDFNQDLLKSILTKYTVHYSITKQAGGYSHYDGTYVIEDSFKITIIGDYTDEMFDLFIENLKEFFEQETLLFTVQELDMEYR